MEEQGATISRSQFRMISQIGIGCQAEVFKVQEISTCLYYALKIMQCSRLSQAGQARIEFQIKANLHLSQTVNSYLFPQLQAYWQQKQAIHLLFELCDENAQTEFSNLASYSQKYNYLLVLLFDILMALKTLQGAGIIHRDIKPENILIKEGGFKLTDFGLATDCKQGYFDIQDIGNKLGRSPEFMSGNYTYKTDVWSLGIHVFYMLENTLPFDEASLWKIKRNRNALDSLLTSQSVEIDLQPQGRKTKNPLSFIHIVLSEMIVLDQNSRKDADYLLQSYFGWSNQIDMQNMQKSLLMGYLYERDHLGEYYLLLLLGFTDYYRMDGRIKEEMQTNKKIICLKVKQKVFQILEMTSKFMKNIKNTRLMHHMKALMMNWSIQLRNEGLLQDNPLLNINSALQIYNIPKVKDKFPLIEWMVKIYQSIESFNQGVKPHRISIWQIPIDLSKIL